MKLENENIIFETPIFHNGVYMLNMIDIQWLLNICNSSILENIIPDHKRLKHSFILHANVS